jgi:hypothetical protein
MKHPGSNCDCTATASPLVLRWWCSVCGNAAIMKVSILAAICDGDTIRRVEPADAAARRQTAAIMSGPP